MRIIITISELQALDTNDLVEALEYVEADIERADEMGGEHPFEYVFDVCTVEVDE